jgi:hypothetical protein
MAERDDFVAYSRRLADSLIDRITKEQLAAVARLLAPSAVATTRPQADKRGDSRDWWTL